MDVTRIGPPLLPTTSPATPAATPSQSGASFGEIFMDSLSQVDKLEHDADKASKELSTGGPTTLHDTMLALEKAELSLRLMMQVRNKIVEAYQEVLRMQV